MITIRQIVRQNTATFYNYRTNARIHIWPRLFITALVSLALSVALVGRLKDFLNGIIPVQAILLGFGFSVMFFLVTGRTAPSDDPDLSIERRNREERINTLSNELFHNISYFNLTAISCLIFALILLVQNPDHFIVEALKKWPPPGGRVARDAYAIIQNVIAVAVGWGLLFLTAESGYTFARIVGRVSYLFEQRLKATEGPPG